LEITAGSFFTFFSCSEWKLVEGRVAVEVLEAREGWVSDNEVVAWMSWSRLEPKSMRNDVKPTRYDRKMSQYF